MFALPAESTPILSNGGDVPFDLSAASGGASAFASGRVQYLVSGNAVSLSGTFHEQTDGTGTAVGRAGIDLVFKISWRATQRVSYRVSGYVQTSKTLEYLTDFLSCQYGGTVLAGLPNLVVGGPTNFERTSEIFPGETRPHPWAYVLTPVRLYRRDLSTYSTSPVHDRVVVGDGVTVGWIKGRIHHFSVRSLGDQLDKLNRYSDQQADDLDARGVTIPSWRLFVELPGNFLKAYFGRRHFVRGAYGFLTAMNYAISRHLRVAKHYERRVTTPRKPG